MNPRFEKHEGKLFRMLEEPVPCQGQLKWNYIAGIAHDKPLLIRDIPKIVNPRISIKTLNDLSKVKYVVHYDMPAEIIGTFVEEGSEDWALYSAMNGKSFVHKDAKQCRIFTMFSERELRVSDGEGETVEYVEIDEFLNDAAKDGWQLYDTEQKFANVKAGDSIMCSDGRVRIVDSVGKKPDKRNGKLWFNLQVEDWGLRTFYFDGTLQVPERELRFTLEYVCEPKPLLADAKVGDLCKRMDGKWVQIETLCSLGGMPWICYEIGGLRYINNGEQLNTKDRNLDIIHTEPLAPEGTKEWAWQMAKLGIETRCYKGKIRVSKSGLIEVCYNGMAYAMPLTQSAENRQYVINKIRECSPDGWQIYEKPKPESENIIYHIPADMRPEYFHLCKFKVGDWVECNGNQRLIESISRDLGRGNYYHFAHGFGGAYAKSIARKLKPSEVVVQIGCLSGTIAKSCDPNYFLMLHSRPMTDCNHSMIRFSAIDTQTRELVESLLEAMRGES